MENKKEKLLENFIGQSLLSFCEEHYSENIVKAFKGELEEEDRKKIEGCQKASNRDNRTAEDIARDIIKGWICEDKVIQILEGMGFTVRHSGVDSDRQFYYNKQLNSDPDFYVEKDGNCYYLEQISDYGGYWERMGYADLRLNKFPQLKKKAEEIRTFLIALDLQNAKIGFIEITPNTPGEHIPLIPAYRKEGYRVKIDYGKFKKIA